MPAVQRVVPGAHHALQVLEHARVHAVGAGPRQIGRDLAILRRKARNLGRAELLQPQALGACGERAECFPALPLLHHEPLRGDGGAADPLCAPGGEAPPALGQLGAVQLHQEGLGIGVPPRESRREPSHELGRESVPHCALEALEPLEHLVEQAELLVGELGRARFERLGLPRAACRSGREL